jgi:hypothetical protein
MTMSSEERKFNPGELYWSLVEPVWDEIEIYQGPEEFAVRRNAGIAVTTNATSVRLNQALGHD